MTMSVGNLYGVAFVIAALYYVVNALGANTTVFDIAVMFPVVAGTATCLAMYFFVKDAWGKGAGLIAALFMALSASNISRTSLGFLRHEPLGILLMILIFTFFLRSISPKSSPRATVVFGLLTGFLLYYLAASWAAFYFAVNLLVLFAGVLALVGRYDRRLLLSYASTFGFFLLLTPLLVPKIGFASLKDFSFLTIPAGAVLVLGREAATRVTSRQARIYGVIGISAATIAAVVLLAYFRVISLPGGKFYSILNPLARGDVPIIQSVAEHQPATWASFFYEFGTLTFLMLLGFVFAAQRMRNSDVFLILYGATSLYFAASFVRLTLVLAPAFYALAAASTVELGKPAVDILREAVIYPKKRVRVMTKVGREFGAAILLILLIMIMPAFWRSINSAYAPATIVTSSIPNVPEQGQEQRFQDWLETLAWMKENTAPDSVIFAWWDYGYWITALGERRSLADNGTQNATQIAKIAQTFLLNESFALPNLKRWNVTHVAVFVTFQSQQGGGSRSLGFGEDGKWYWMARIGNNTRWGDLTVIFQDKRNPTSGGATYYRVLRNGTKTLANETITDQSNNLKDNTMLGSLIKLGTERTERQSPFFRLQFSSSNRFVLLFQVRYLTRSVLKLQPIVNVIQFGQSVRFNGTLRDEFNKTIPTAAVAIEASNDGGNSWGAIDKVFAGNGTFIYDWTPKFAGRFHVRANYEGVEDRYTGAFTDPTPLIVEAQKGKITLKVTPANVTLGTNVTLTVTIDPSYVGAAASIEFSTNNVTWTRIQVIPLVNGTGTFSWAAPSAGTFYVRAVTLPAQNYQSVTSSSVVVGVRPRS